MRKYKRFQIPRRSMPLIATLLVFVLLYTYGGVTYRKFMTMRVFFNLLTDNAVLGITAIGMTFVIISGGIDLSVGAVISTTAMMVAVLLRAGVPNLVILIALSFGTILGLLMGAMIEYFSTPPFIVTLAGMFLLEGWGIFSTLAPFPSVSVLRQNVLTGVRLGTGKLTIPGITLLLMSIIGWYILKWTRFGRHVYALGEVSNLRF